jgi:hypothetical protein
MDTKKHDPQHLSVFGKRNQYQFPFASEHDCGNADPPEAKTKTHKDHQIICSLKKFGCLDRANRPLLKNPFW